MELSEAQQARLNRLMAPVRSYDPLDLSPFGSNPIGVSDQVQELVISFVERQFENPARLVVFEDTRGLSKFYLTMIFKRAVHKFPELQIAALKWTMIEDLLGISLATAGNSFAYNQFMAQQFVGTMHSDGGASVEFIVAKGSNLHNKDYFKDAKEKCVWHFTPELDDIIGSFYQSINEFASEETGPICDYARRLLGRGGGGGWASSR